VLIFLPSVANFRLQWLEERLGTAAAVSVVLVQTDPSSLSRAVQNDVLMAIGAKAIAVRDAGVSRRLVVADRPPQVDEHIEPEHHGPVAAMAGPIDSLFYAGERMLRVFGQVNQSGKEFELIVPDTKLRGAMVAYS